MLFVILASHWYRACSGSRGSDLCTAFMVSPHCRLTRQGTITPDNRVSPRPTTTLPSPWWWTPPTLSHTDQEGTHTEFYVEIILTIILLSGERERERERERKRDHCDNRMEIGKREGEGEAEGGRKKEREKEGGEKERERGEEEEK